MLLEKVPTKSMMYMHLGLHLGWVPTNGPWNWKSAATSFGLNIERGAAPADTWSGECQHPLHPMTLGWAATKSLKNCQRPRLMKHHSAKHVQWLAPRHRDKQQTAEGLETFQ